MLRRPTNTAAAAMPLRRRVALVLLLAAVIVAACAQPHLYTTTTRGRMSVRRRAGREFMTARSPLLQARACHICTS